MWAALVLLLLVILEVADRVVMKRDLQIAKEIQEWLLPANPPAVPGLEIAFATRAANTVAGDYYDVFPRPTSLPDETFLIAIADVAGKSIPAGFIDGDLPGQSQNACRNLRFINGIGRSHECVRLQQ